jgi:hypothetical protein
MATVSGYVTGYAFALASSASLTTEANRSNAKSTLVVSQFGTRELGGD